MPSHLNQSDPPSSETGGFSDYRTSLHQANVTPPPGIPRADFVLALGGNMLGILFGFAPWAVFVDRAGEDAQRIGLTTDGIFAVIAAVVATVALIFAARRGPGGGDFEALIAFGATIASFIAAGFTLMYIDAQPIDNIKAGTLETGWGIYAATIASAVTIVFTFRVLRATRYY